MRMIKNLECATGNLGIGYIDENDNYLELDEQLIKDILKASLTVQLKSPKS